MGRVYIAAPFFNEKQLQIVEDIKAILDKENIEYFSPKDESMFKQGDNPRTILSKNCQAIDSAPFIIVVTDDKDVGTIWEAGYAYAIDTPVLYIWLGYKPDMKFNIMLAASGEVVHNYTDLQYQIRHFKEFDCFSITPDTGMLHE